MEEFNAGDMFVWQVNQQGQQVMRLNKLVGTTNKRNIVELEYLNCWGQNNIGDITSSYIIA